jgi:hypothetical protein
VIDRSLRTIAIVVLALIAPVIASPRVAAAATAIEDRVAPIVGWSVFDFGRTDRLRAKLAQAERRQAAAESRRAVAESRQAAAEARAHAAETSARLEHAAYEREHVAYQREHAAYLHEHIAYERELATIVAYRKQSDVQRDRLARLNAQNARLRWLAQIASKSKSCSVVAAAPLPAKHASPAVHRPPRPIVAVPRSPAKEPRPAATRNLSVGWGAI